MWLSQLPPDAQRKAKTGLYKEIMCMMLQHIHSRQASENHASLQLRVFLTNCAQRSNNTSRLEGVPTIFKDFAGHPHTLALELPPIDCKDGILEWRIGNNILYRRASDTTTSVCSFALSQETKKGMAICLSRWHGWAYVHPKPHRR